MRYILVLFASLGWIVPFSVSILVTLQFIRDVVYPAAAFRKLYDYPFHSFYIVQYIFSFSMIWAFLSGAYWILKGRR